MTKKSEAFLRERLNQNRNVFLFFVGGTEENKFYSDFFIDKKTDDA
jgi:hypothetical protein